MDRCLHVVWQIWFFFPCTPSLIHVQGRRHCIERIIVLLDAEMFDLVFLKFPELWMLYLLFRNFAVWYFYLYTLERIKVSLFNMVSYTIIQCDYFNWLGCHWWPTFSSILVSRIPHKRNSTPIFFPTWKILNWDKYSFPALWWVYFLCVVDSCYTLCLCRLTLNCGRSWIVLTYIIYLMVLEICHFCYQNWSL